MKPAAPGTRRDRRRWLFTASIDSFCWLFALCTAVILRYDQDLLQPNWASIAILASVAMLLQVGVGHFGGLYAGRHRYGTFHEVRPLTASVLAVTILLSTFVVFFGPAVEIPRSTVFIAFPLVLVVALGVRYIIRLLIEHARRPAQSSPPALIVGAGDMGDALLRMVLTNPVAPFSPIGIIDDDLQKQNLRLRGVPVLGTSADIAEIAARTGAKILVIAVNAADSRLMRKFYDAAEGAGLTVAVLPTPTQVITGEATAGDIRKVSIEDLIGRNPVDTNVELIAGYVTGRRVLVTGAGGSIGSELCRQLSKYGPSELTILDRDETGLQTTQLSVSGHGLLDTNDIVLADIRGAENLRELFIQRKPEVVFHAAALKHLPMLEQYPDEAWETNVLGTLNVLNAARAAGVDTFVNISTDKAANPTSVLGHSKRVAEKLTGWAAGETGMRYLSVRFGNVIGSRGSMLPTFQSLIESGGPITVTHPDVTRYFMTIPEACQLVIQAGAIGRAGEVLILDMGEPVSILDVAKRMITMSGKPIEIVFTGLRPGEKIHEELVGQRENLERPYHPKISHTLVDILSPDKLEKAGWEARMFAIPRDNDTTEIQRMPSRIGSTNE
ncbi:polysaccharide biosynthesis protein [Nesterenkonia aurantiaca]|uniref:polysaccharide biosynthesis protein n=1 Tax=Nesterenkonia aurantiaca TaxID=1436010 RepID=UPI003EE814B0